MSRSILRWRFRPPSSARSDRPFSGLRHYRFRRRFDDVTILASNSMIRRHCQKTVAIKVSDRLKAISDCFPWRCFRLKCLAVFKSEERFQSYCRQFLRIICKSCFSLISIHSLRSSQNETSNAK